MSGEKFLETTYGYLTLLYTRCSQWKETQSTQLHLYRYAIYGYRVCKKIVVIIVASVAAHLQGLWTVASCTEGHTRD